MTDVILKQSSRVKLTQDSDFVGVMAETLCIEFDDRAVATAGCGCCQYNIYPDEAGKLIDHISDLESEVARLNSMLAKMKGG